MNQRIDGNNNIQAGDNAQVNLYGRGPPSPDNPALMPCPACGRPVSRTANQCPDCSDDLAWRRQLAWEQARQARVVKMAMWLGVIAAVAFILSQLFPSISEPTTIAMVVALGFLLAVISQM